MSDLEDDISELSSLSSYPSSPGASSQIILDPPSDVSQADPDDNDNGLLSHPFLFFSIIHVMVKKKQYSFNY